MKCCYCHHVAAKSTCGTPIRRVVSISERRLSSCAASELVDLKCALYCSGEEAGQAAYSFRLISCCGKKVAFAYAAPRPARCVCVSTTRRCAVGNVVVVGGVAVDVGATAVRATVMPSRTSPRERDDDKTPAIPSSDFKGLRAVLLVTFVVITFGVFIYLQHNVLVDTERFVEKQRPKTLQPGVRKTLRSFNNEGNSGSAASQQLRQGSLKGTVARVADTVQGGFIPRRERPEYLQNNPGSASASGSDAGVVGGFAARPAAGGYIKRDLVAHEGHDVSMPVQMVSDVADCEEVRRYLSCE